MASHVARPDKRDTKGKLLAVRVPDSLLVEIDSLLGALHAEAPWVQMTRSDAVRWLLTVALKAEQQRPGAGPGTA
jgi:hypothetical protein